jgi:hypothetical protein
LGPRPASTVSEAGGLETGSGLGMRAVEKPMATGALVVLFPVVVVLKSR